MKPGRARTGNEKVRNLFYCFIGVYLSGILIGIITYGEPFRFLRYPISDLGARLTAHGFQNGRSILAFAATMIACGVLLITVAAVCATDRSVRHRVLKCVLGLTGGFGCFLAVFPHDMFVVQHGVGSGFFVGAIYFFSLLFLDEARPGLSTPGYYLEQIILQVSVYPYAVIWLMDLEVKNAWQKVTLFGLSAIAVLSAYQHARTPRHPRAHCSPQYRQ